MTKKPIRISQEIDIEPGQFETEDDAIRHFHIVGRSEDHFRFNLLEVLKWTETRDMHLKRPVFHNQEQ
jgi:hypothetical protein